MVTLKGGSVLDCRVPLGEGLLLVSEGESLMVFRESVSVPHESEDGCVLRLVDSSVDLLALLQQRCWLPNPK